MTSADFSDVHAVQLTIYGEARNQPVLGLVAVGCVIQNRLRLARWGPTWRAVCLAPRQFSCWNASDPNRPMLEALAARLRAGDPIEDPVLEVCGDLAARAIAGRVRDVTRSATHYYAPAGVVHAGVVHVPTWAAPPALLTATIGGHQFYGNVG